MWNRKMRIMNREGNNRGGLLWKGLFAWALAFGCVIGRGSFVMPGTTFLPDAGPIGSLIGIVIAAAIALIVGLNKTLLRNSLDEHSNLYQAKNIV